MVPSRMSLPQKVRECWLLRKGSSVDSDEEELYAAGNMVIGSKSQASRVYKAFTVGSPVLQNRMLWNSVYCPEQLCECAQCDTELGLTELGLNLPSTLSGLQCVAHKIWSAVGTQKALHPRLLQVLPGNLFPLYSVCCTLWMRVVCIPTGLFEAACVQYVSDSTMKIIFFNCKPSIVI
ncbi:anaphase-promoting complex subunit 1 isoform X2 [Oncorhynchus mykiss]|uniref:anaphase-promoting complex subunit 1 isoform X2 n=1 Tax=Oncorhynchus mykiss TaxID=8022 RepID=UPI00187871CB|nr:anaphase-promoting complex subunit 1 isoform X2 [Oncorhynchus mykiss]